VLIKGVHFIGLYVSVSRYKEYFIFEMRFLIANYSKIGVQLDVARLSVLVSSSALSPTNAPNFSWERIQSGTVSHSGLPPNY
jgi:hypothetical protein